MANSQSFAFANSAPIIIPSDGAATPYPSSITVSGLPQYLRKVTVTLHGFSHSYPSDVAVLLVGPSGRHALLMSGAGGSVDVFDVELTFDDDAVAPLPENGALTSGTFRPSNLNGINQFLTPAPSGPYNTSLGAFIGSNPNGTWRLYVGDPFFQDGGLVGGGWSLSLSTVPPSLSIEDAETVEGDAGVTLIHFPIRLSSPQNETVSVDFQTMDGSATGGEDYVARFGTLEFAAGVTNILLTVPVLGDTLMESNETLTVLLSHPVGAPLEDPEAVGIIIDDDTPPANGLFADRIPIEGEVFFTVGSNAGAVKEPGEPDHDGDRGGASVWWTWTAPQSGQVILRADTTSFASLLSVYTGTGFADLAPVAHQQTLDGFSNRIRFNAVSNVNYAIALDGLDGAAGNFTLRLDLSPGEFLVSDQPRDDLWVTDGVVLSVVETNGIVYVGGWFDNVFPNFNRTELVDDVSGLADPDFPEIEGTVYEAIPDGLGGWFLAGEFIQVGDVGRTNLAHLLPDKTVDPEWAPFADGIVYDLVQHENRLYLGGNFTNCSGVVRRKLASVDASTGAITTWNPGVAHEFAPLYPGIVTSLAVQSNTVFVGGQFTHVGGQARQNIAALDAVTGELFPWRCDLYGPDRQYMDPLVNGAKVLDLAVETDTVYVAGYFTEVAGQSRQNLTAIDADSGLPRAWNPNPNRDVHTLVLACDQIYAGGVFTIFGGQARNHLAAISLGSDQALPWNPNPNGFILSMALQHETLFIGGLFSQVGGQPRHNVAAIDILTASPTPWAPKAGNNVHALSVQGRRALMGSDTTKGAVRRRNLAAFNAATGELTPWNPGPNNLVSCLAATDKTVYAGGSFTAIGNQSRSFIGAIDVVSGLPTAWNPGADHFPQVLDVTEEVVYAGGLFDRIGGARRPRLAALDRMTGQATNWRPVPEADWNGFDVRWLNVLEDTVYVAGTFSAMGGANRRGFAALDATTANATSWNPNATGGTVVGEFIQVRDQTVYMTGSFTTIGGQPRTLLAALDVSNGLATSWNPMIGPPGGRIPAIALQGDILYSGGRFDSVESVSRRNATAFDLTDGRLLPWNPNPTRFVENPSIWTLEASAFGLYAGGLFTSIGDRPRTYFAAFPPLGAPFIQSQPKGHRAPEGQTVTLVAEATGQPPLLYQWQYNGIDIPGANDAMYTITNVTTVDSGEYTLVARNGLGRIRSRPARVTVFTPLLITLEPASQSVSPGADVALGVQAGGFPSPSYQWRLNGVNIPGAFQSTYTITNAQPIDGGTYDVVVANVGGSALSQPATVLISSHALLFVDDFSDRTVHTEDTRQGGGTNVGATREDAMDEPFHVGKPSGASVWLSWIAPSNGIATFSTRGSSFDTLLAVYTGKALDTLELVAADEDQGGFLTSQVSFNATNGTEYAIAVDGFARATGNILLSWSMDVIESPVARILRHPLSRSVTFSQSHAFSVLASSPTPLTYQWFFGCEAIPGATNATLTINNARSKDIGAYRVFVMNDSTRVAESFPARLEIGPVAEVVSQDKPENLLLGLFDAQLGQSLDRSSLSVAAGYISIPLGGLGSQRTDNRDAQTGEILCGVFGHSSLWLWFRPETDGLLQFDTRGSQIDTVLAAYLWDVVGWNRIELVCDDSDTRGGHSSLLRLPAQAGLDYLVAAAAVHENGGDIKFNWGLTRDLRARRGGDIILTADIEVTGPSASYQWYLNRKAIVGATNRTWAVSNLQLAGAGEYSVVAGDGTATTTNLVAVLTVQLPLLEYEPRFHEGVIRVWVPMEVDQPVLLESSPDLNPTNWLPMRVIEPGIEPRYFDWEISNPDYGFLRAMTNSTAR